MSVRLRKSDLELVTRLAWAGLSATTGTSAMSHACDSLQSIETACSAMLASFEKTLTTSGVVGGDRSTVLPIIVRYEALRNMARAAMDETEKATA